MRQFRVWTIVLAGAAYVLVGVGTAVLAARAASPVGVKGWRLAAWLLSLAVFGLHFVVARRRGGRRVGVAAQVALAVAVGALGVAAFGPVRSHWGDPSRLKVAVLSLVAWPIVTGVPAFLAALLGGFVLDRAAGGTRHTSSGLS